MSVRRPMTIHSVLGDRFSNKTCTSNRITKWCDTSKPQRSICRLSRTYIIVANPPCIDGVIRKKMQNNADHKRILYIEPTYDYAQTLVNLRSISISIPYRENDLTKICITIRTTKRCNTGNPERSTYRSLRIRSPLADPFCAGRWLAKNMRNDTNHNIMYLAESTEEYRKIIMNE